MRARGARTPFVGDAVVMKAGTRARYPPAFLIFSFAARALSVYSLFFSVFFFPAQQLFELWRCDKPQLFDHREKNATNRPQPTVRSSRSPGSG